MNRQMKSRGKLAILAILLVATTIALLAFLLLPRGPIYKGKTVNQWISELPSGGQVTPFGLPPDQYTPAKEAIREIGTNAVPHLARAINRKDSPFASLFAKAWPKLPPFIRGRIAQPTYPIEIRRDAARLLAEIVRNHPSLPFDEIVPHLSKAVHQKDGAIQIIAASTLGTLAVRNKSRPALLATIQLLSSTNAVLRSHAAWSLSSAGPVAADALPALRNRLRDPDVAVRINAALAAYRIGNLTNEPVAVLIEALKDSVPTHRGNAANHLSQIGPAARPAIPVLKSLLEDVDDYPRNWARVALNRIAPAEHPEEKPDLETLIHQLSNPDSLVGLRAAVALKSMGDRAKAAVPALLRELTGSQTENLCVVADALWEISGEHAAEIVPRMIAYLQNTGQLNRHSAAGVLARMGAPANATVPALTASLEDRNPQVRESSAYALLKIGVQDETLKRRSVAVLIDGLQPKRGIYRRGTVHYLIDLGPVAKDALPALRELANDMNADAELKESARKAIGVIHPEAATPLEP